MTFNVTNVTIFTGNMSDQMGRTHLVTVFVFPCILPHAYTSITHGCRYFDAQVDNNAVRRAPLGLVTKHSVHCYFGAATPSGIKKSVARKSVYLRKSRMTDSELSDKWQAPCQH